MDAVFQSLVSNFDVRALDQVVEAAYNPVHPNRSQANKALMQLQETPDLWTKADEIMENSQNPQTRFFGLQVLDDAIKTRSVSHSIGHFFIFIHCTCITHNTYELYNVLALSNSIRCIIALFKPDGISSRQISAMESKITLWVRSYPCHKTKPQ